MRILLLATHLEPGGITSYTITLAEALSRLGHHVRLASRGGPGVSILERLDLPHVWIPIRSKSELDPRLLASAWHLHRLIHRGGIELIHAQTRVAAWVGHLLARVEAIPVMTTCHGSPRRRATKRWLPLWGDCVIAVSRHTGSHLAGSLGVEPGRIRVVPNGVWLDVPAGLNGRRGTPAGEIPARAPGHVLAVVCARLVPEKGHDVLLHAFARIVKRVPAHLVIVGSGRLDRPLRHLARRLDLDETVSFLGSLPDGRTVLEHADLVVAPSREEGAGWAVLEAMALGKAVVASDVGGLREVVEDGRTGWLVPPGDSRALADRMLALIHDPGMRRRMGDAGRARASAHFSSEQMATRTAAVYREVLAARRRR